VPSPTRGGSSRPRRYSNAADLRARFDKANEPLEPNHEHDTRKKQKMHNLAVTMGTMHAVSKFRRGSAGRNRTAAAAAAAARRRQSDDEGSDEASSDDQADSGDGASDSDSELAKEVHEQEEESSDDGIAMDFPTIDEGDSDGSLEAPFEQEGDARDASTSAREVLQYVRGALVSILPASIPDWRSMLPSQHRQQSSRKYNLHQLHNLPIEAY
jgi:hypothetical protein